MSGLLFNCTVSVLFAILLSRIHFIVVVEKDWGRGGSKDLAVMICWESILGGSLVLVACCSEDDDWWRDGKTDSE